MYDGRYDASYPCALMRENDGDHKLPFVDAESLVIRGMADRAHDHPPRYDRTSSTKFEDIQAFVNGDYWVFKETEKKVTRYRNVHLSTWGSLDHATAFAQPEDPKSLRWRHITKSV